MTVVGECLSGHGCLMVTAAGFVVAEKLFTKKVNCRFTLISKCLIYIATLVEWVDSCQTADSSSASTVDCSPSAVAVGS